MWKWISKEWPFTIIVVVLLALVVAGFVQRYYDAEPAIESIGTGAIAAAKTREAKIGIAEEAKGFGIVIGVVFEKVHEERYRQFRDRLFANADLAAAFHVAKRHGALIYLSEDFRTDYGKSFLHISINATDQEIINFLLRQKSE